MKVVSFLAIEAFPGKTVFLGRPSFNVREASDAHIGHTGHCGQWHFFLLFLVFLSFLMYFLINIQEINKSTMKFR